MPLFLLVQVLKKVASRHLGPLLLQSQQLSLHFLQLHLQRGVVTNCLLAHRGSVLDNLRALGELQSAKGLLKCGEGWRDVGNKAALGHSTERVLEEEGELAVPVWNVPLLAVSNVNQRLDDVTERGQTLIDAASFLQCLANCLAVFLPLRSCEVNQVERGAELLLQPSGPFAKLLLHRENEHGVGTARLSVRGGGAHVPALASALEQGVRLLRVCHLLYRCAVHLDAPLPVLPHRDVLLLFRVKQVEDNFVVDLEVRDRSGVLIAQAFRLVRLLLVVEVVEDVLKHPRQQAELVLANALKV